jgi:magnesium chelatase accessory protein
MSLPAHGISRGWSASVSPAGGNAAHFLPADWPHRELSRFVEAGRTRWHVQRTGQGRRLLLVHGTAASTHTWRGLLPLLAADYDVLAMDLPGHGYTERLPNQAMSLPALAGGLDELLATLDFEPRYVIGHSAGAAIALEMALDHTIRPDAIVGLNAALLPFGGGLRQLFAPLARFFANTQLMPRMIARRARDPEAVRRVLDSTGSSIDGDGVRFYQQLLTREDHVAAVLAMMASWDLQPILARLDKLEPLLHLIVGATDKAISPREAESIARVLPGTTVDRIDGCGHLAHEEAPGSVARLIADYCRDPGRPG